MIYTGANDPGWEPPRFSSEDKYYEALEEAAWEAFCEDNNIPKGLEIDEVISDVLGDFKAPIQKAWDEFRRDFEW